MTGFGPLINFFRDLAVLRLKDFEPESSARIAEALALAFAQCPSWSDGPGPGLMEGEGWGEAERLRSRGRSLLEMMEGARQARRAWRERLQASDLSPEARSLAGEWIEAAWDCFENGLIRGGRAGEVYHELMARSPDIVMRFDRRFRHLYASPSVERVVDYEASRFLGRTHRELGFPEEQCRFWEERIARVFATGEPDEAEFEYESPSGTVVFNWRLLPVPDREGQVESVLTVARDITEHRLSEVNLRQLFEHLLDGFSLHEIIVDERGEPVDYRFIAVNPAFEKLTGLQAGDLIGRTVREVMPNIESHWIQTYGRVAQTGEPAQFENFSVELGKRFRVDAFCPRPGQFACLFRDVTERKRQDEERLRTQKLESLGILAGGIAHDFNNILTGVYGNIQLARFMSEDLPDVQEVLADAEQSSLRATALTKKLLTFSRGGAPVKREAHPGDLVRESALFVLHGSKVAPLFTFADYLPLVEVDEGQIGQVIGAVVINSIQAMPEGGSLAIEVVKETVAPDLSGPPPPGDYVRISVIDRGVGIAPEHLPRVFDPYFTTKDRSGGLGLATAFSIVKNHGGTIAIESELGEGTTVRVWLPTAESKARVEAPEAVESVGPPPRVLVMDDEDLVKGVIRRMLERLGYDPVLTADGREAVECWRQARSDGRPFAAAILDLTVPGGMGGQDAAREILQLDPEASLIVASGYSNDPVLSDYADYGFKAVITKPVDLDHLKAAMTVARR